MKSKYFQLGHNKLAYTVFGEGEEVLVLFHGFGQSKTVFYDLPETVTVQFKLIAIDLFGHGKSSFFNKTMLTPEDWKVYVEGVLQEESVGEFSILGFSLGGRVAINTAFVLKNRVKGLVLLAPDGIVESLIYKLATRNWLFKRLFKKFVFKPHFYQKIIVMLKKMRVIDSSVSDFFLRVLEYKNRRFKLYRIWNMYAGMSVPFEETVQLFNWKPQVFLAERDLLVDNRKVEKTCKRLMIPLKVLPISHFRVIEYYFKSRAKFFS